MPPSSLFSHPLSSVPLARLSDVTGAGNNREIPRLHKPISHRERRCEYDAGHVGPRFVSLNDFKHSHWAPQSPLTQHYLSYPISICLTHPFASTTGASHSRGFPEDPEGGGEEEEERRKEERNQERPPYLALSHWAIALHWTTAQRAEAKGMGVYAAVAKVWWWWCGGEGGVGLTCRLQWWWSVLLKEEASKWHQKRWGGGFWQRPESLYIYRDF